MIMLYALIVKKKNSMNDKKDVHPLFGDVVFFENSKFLPVKMEVEFAVFTGVLGSPHMSMAFGKLCYLDAVSCIAFSKAVTPTFKPGCLEYKSLAQVNFWNMGNNKKSPRKKFTHKVNIWICKKPIEFYEPRNVI